MRLWIGAAMAACLVSGGAHAGEIGDELAQALSAGTVAEVAGRSAEACAAGVGDACLALGLNDLITAYETFAVGLYRHGAVTPNSPAMGMLLGMGMEAPPAQTNADPEPLSYAQLRDILETFSKTLDAAAGHMQQAGEGSAFVIPIDPLRVRLDLNGDGETGEGETLAAVLASAGAALELPDHDTPPPSSKTKSKGGGTPADATIGFDNADAIWFAGYANIAAVPVEMTLSHDFSAFFDAYLHRVFPKAGLPMGDYMRGGTMMIDAESDAFIADMIAALHAADFPVIDEARFSGVLARLETITALSRRNWEMILAETDDNRELVPSPTQTSMMRDRPVTLEVVQAWRDTLDQLDRILGGELLLPHWRFSKGFNLKTYFETATRTDLVMLLTGHDALPFLADGPVASADDFAELNRVMGDDWPFFAIWFN